MAKRSSVELSKLTQLLAAGDVAGAQKLLDRHAGRAALRSSGVAAEDGVLEDARAGPVSLADACPGREVTAAAPLGERAYWLIGGAVTDALPEESPVEAEYAAVLRGARQRFDELSASAALCQLADGGPGDPLFMDIETCGLSGAMIFLVGLMRYEQGRLVYAQHLARDYSEEAPVLTAFAEALRAAGVLVTFNGKSFDMPMVRERSIIHRVELPPAAGPRDNRMPPHLDLLHDARRRWKGQLPNCRLQTLESCLCRRARSGDIPGGDIPDAYHKFVRDGDATQLRAILHHNLLDMLTMVQLVCILLTSCEAEI